MILFAIAIECIGMQKYYFFFGYTNFSYKYFEIMPDSNSVFNKTYTIIKKTTASPPYFLYM